VALEEFHCIPTPCKIGKSPFPSGVLGCHCRPTAFRLVATDPLLCVYLSPARLARKLFEFLEKLLLIFSGLPRLAISQMVD
jgi:hypothetical protein